MSAFKDIFLDTSGITVAQAEALGNDLARWQRDVNWMIGDLARYARHNLKLGDNYSQVFPTWVSPGLIQRCEAVSAAYPREEDRNILATWSVHMQNANRTDRIARVAAHVEAGRTSDEARRADKQERAATNGPRWLLAVDVNYFLHRFWHSGAGVEAAIGVATWVQRTVERLKETMGLTDCVCCFDSRTNHRKELTREWEDKYKDRPPKDPELGQQLNLVHELLNGHGFACVSIEGMEADDIMASYAKHFPGRVTLLTQDKDCKQCLSSKCNMLLDVEWTTDEHSGESIPDYKWLTAKAHTAQTRISPAQWIEFQCIAGDATDGIKGAIGIGAVGAAELVMMFGTVEGAIAAAKADDERIKPRQRKALIEFEPKAAVTRQLVTLRTDLELSVNTRI